MSKIIFGNNAATTIAGNITPISTQVALAAGSGAIFPKPQSNQYFIATFVDKATGTIREIVHVTSLTGDVATIVRAQEGFNAGTWTAGDVFAHLHTAGAMRSFIQTDDFPDTGLVHSGDDESSVPNSLIVTSTIPPLEALVPDTVFNVLVANTNTGPAFLTISPSTQYPIYRADGNPLQSGDLSTGQQALFIFTGNSYQLVNFKQPKVPSTVFPFSCWGGIFGGTPTLIQATVPGDIAYPYPGGLMITGLTGSINTGALTMSVNGNPAVKLLYEDGSEFVGNEFKTLHTLIMAISDGINFRCIGTLGFPIPAAPVPPPVIPPPIPPFKYGDHTCLYVELTSRKQTFPNDYFCGSEHYCGHKKEVYGADWIHIGSLASSYYMDHKNIKHIWSCGHTDPNWDKVEALIYQRAGGGGFNYGDVGSIYLEISGTIPSGFASTQTLTGRTKESYGPFWQQVGYFEIFCYDDGGTAHSPKCTIFQRVASAPVVLAEKDALGTRSLSSGYGGQHSCCCDGSRSPYYRHSDPHDYNKNRDCHSICGKKPEEFGGSWFRCFTFTIQIYYNDPEYVYTLDMPQRIL